MADCVFCKIISGEIPSKKVYEDDKIIAIHDLNPMAPVHVLFIPKEHICCANAITEENSGVVAHIFTKIPVVAKELGLENGYRVVNNCGEDGGQTVMHLHFHLLGGKKLGLNMA
jgi:histidine triad (HIT) family protein